MARRTVKLGVEIDARLYKELVGVARKVVNQSASISKAQLSTTFIA